MPSTAGRPRYNHAHSLERARWQQIIDREGSVCHAVICLLPSRAIRMGEKDWDLGHTPDGQQWTGPEHPRCNRSEGQRRGMAMRIRAQEIAERESRWDL